MAFSIVTDSSCNLPESYIAAHHLQVIPLLYRLQDKEYRSGQSGAPTLQEFYAALRQKATATTSGVVPQDCLDLFRAELDAGHDVLYLGFSSGLSSTYQTASAALQTLSAEYPARKVRAIDSLAAALGEGLLVSFTVDLRDQGRTLEETADWLIRNRLRLCHWFTVDDLFFLHRGGRVSRASALVGSLVGIKPVLHVDENGCLSVVAKVRGRRAAMDMLVEKACTMSDDPSYRRVYIAHGDCEDAALYVRDQLAERRGVQDFIISCLEPVIGGHAGPGTLAVFFLGDCR